MSDKIIVAVVRPLMWHNEPVPPGATLKVTASEAQGLVDSGRARLVHAADQRLLADATRAEIRAALKAERANWQPADVSPPWERRG